MVGRLLSVVTLAVLIWACGGSASGEPTPPPPVTTTVETVGIIAEESARDGRRSFVLADGREVSYDERVVRIPFHSGGGARLLVAGTDPTGPWLVVAGKQDGMPADCNVINRAGLEWGMGVALFGLLWPKSEGFVSDIALPPFGAPYPDGTRFCLDDAGRLERVVGP